MVLKIPKHLDLQEVYDMQYFNLEEDSSNHFSSNRFAFDKVALPFAIVLVLSSVARYFSSI